LFSLDGEAMTAFRITTAILALLGSAWIIWDLRWRGVYIVGMIVATVFVERWATQIGWNRVLSVLAFIAVAAFLGFRFFGLATPRRR
jgi:hypothetical protein